MSEERLSRLEEQYRKVIKWLVEIQRRLNRLDPLPEAPNPPHTLPRHYTGPDAQLIDVPEIELPNRHEQHEQKSGPPT